MVCQRQFVHQSSEKNTNLSRHESIQDMAAPCCQIPRGTMYIHQRPSLAPAHWCAPPPNKHVTQPPLCMCHPLPSQTVTPPLACHPIPYFWCVIPSAFVAKYSTNPCCMIHLSEHDFWRKGQLVSGIFFDRGLKRNYFCNKGRQLKVRHIQSVFRPLSSAKFMWTNFLHPTGWLMSAPTLLIMSKVFVCILCQRQAVWFWCIQNTLQ